MTLWLWIEVYKLRSSLAFESEL